MIAAQEEEADQQPVEAGNQYSRQLYAIRW